MFQKYKPTGRIGGLTLPMTLVGMLVATGLAYVYQFLLHWIPLIYINFLLTLGVGFSLGVIGAFIVRIGHCRNVPVAALIAILLAGSCLGAKFWFQYTRIFDETVDLIVGQEGVPADQREDVAKILATDMTFFKHLELRAEQGWAIGRAGRGGGAPTSGVFVYMVWLVEAGVLFVLAVMVSVRAANQPYSENKKTWADEAEVVMSLPIDEPEMVSKIRSAQSVDELLQIPIPKTDESNQFAVYSVNSIPGEEMEDAYLSVDLVTLSVNNKGEEKKEEQSLVKHAIFSSTQRQELKENASLLYEAMSAYRVALEEEQAADAKTDKSVMETAAEVREELDGSDSGASGAGND